MDDANDDGGPAFPVPSYVNADGETHHSSVQGMTLRDWFAGQALAGLAGAGFGSPAGNADFAYLLADAMLKSRKGNA